MSVTINNVVYYQIDSLTAKTGFIDGTPIHVTIEPTVTINGTVLTVTEIGEYTFNYADYLKSVVIPNTITVIGDNAFEYCTNLESVNIPNSVTTIWNRAFAHSGLTNVTIPDGTTLHLQSFVIPTLVNVTIENPRNTNAIAPFMNNQNSTINFYNTENYDALNNTWKTISQQFTTQNYYNFSPNVPPTIGPLIIPEKTFGDSLFTITQPTSNSGGAFSYTSSNTDVATIAGNILTIVAPGNSLITATQAPFGTYSEGSVQTTFIVNPSTPENPVLINTPEQLDYAMNTSAEYIDLEQSLNINYDLISATQKVLTGNNITILKTLVD